MDNDIAKVHTSFVNNTTNNRTEMLAVINAMKSLNGKDTANIISDSGYVVNGYNKPSYLDTWIKSNWKTSNKSDVQNRDLWEEILKLTYHNGVKFNLIKGHYKDPNVKHAFWNAVVDRACTHIMKHHNYEEEMIMEFHVKSSEFTIMYPVFDKHNFDIFNPSWKMLSDVKVRRK